MYEPLQLGPLTLPGDRPFLVAEAGVNHENSLDDARRMIEEAAAAGADAIKFQSYKAETLASRFSPSYWDLGAEPTASQYDLFKKYDGFGAEDYVALSEHARQHGIVFMSTPFDAHFVDVLDACMPVYKIASADLTNQPLLRHCASKGKPMILSTGAATLAEVDEALRVLRKAGNPQVALLHCVLSYPCRPEDANLRIIETLRGIYPDTVIGYSDHVPPQHSSLCLTAAWLLGARILEKHFTLDKSKPGNDHYHAFDPDDIRAFRETCAYATRLMGQRRKDVLPCEEGSRKNARRSLVAGRALRAGEVIGVEDVEVKRPGHGIAPEHLGLVVGAQARCNIEADATLHWDMFLQRDGGLQA